MQVEIDYQEMIWLRRKIVDWGRDNFAHFPWRTTSNHWHALVAEIMLQRTRADQVVPVYEAFCEKYKTPLEYLNDAESNVFGSLGLMWREKLLQALAEVLINKEIPANKQELLNLPGIGDYIAAAYRSMHLEISDTIIDSNIVRIYGRFFGFKTDGETRRKKWFIELAQPSVPQWMKQLHLQSLIYN